MKKSFSIQLAIPEPCTQDWNDMQPVPGGRHCTYCQKAVVDFSRMTDAQLLAYFQRSGGAACGQFRAGQLDRTIKAVEVPRSAWWARVTASLLLVLGLTKNVSAQSKSHEQLSEQNTSENKNKTQITETEYSTVIMGTLKDEKGIPIAKALVQVLNGDMVKGQGLTDFDGNYKITSLERGVYRVKFEYQGKGTTYNTTIVTAGEGKRIDAVLRISNGPYIIMGYMVPLIDPKNLKGRN